MKVLLLHQHFNTPQSGGALRSYFLAKALVEAGIETSVITAHNQPYQCVAVEGIEVHYLPVAYTNSFPFYKRIASFLRFVVQATKTSTHIRNVSLCYAISTPLTVGLVGIWVKWTKRVPMLFETGDLWPDAPIQLGIIKNPLLKILLLGTERFIYKQSKGIVALSVPMKAILERRTHRPVHLLPNMADTDYFKPEAKDPDLEKKFGVQGKFVVSYIGSVGFANGLDYFLDFARAAQQQALPVAFIICGEGAMLSYLKNTATNLRLSNLLFLPLQNREGVRKLMNITDAVYISYQQQAILETGSPNKYFDGLAASKLIIANVGGWIKEEIERNECGFGYDPNQPEEAIRCLRVYLNDHQKLTSAKGQAHQVGKRYARQALSHDFVKLIQGLA